MADAPGFSEEQILADFYETQPHFTESENVQSTSENQARVILVEESTESTQSTGNDEVEKTIVEVYDSESDSPNGSKTTEKTPQVSATSPVISDFGQSPRPSFDRRAEEQKSERKFAASAPPTYRKPLHSVQKRPSTTKTFRRKLTSRGFKKKVIQSPLKRNSRSTTAPNTPRHEMGNSENFPQTSATGRASTAGPSLRILTQERQETVVEIDDSSPPPSRIGSAKLAVRNRLANLMRAEMTMRGMKDDVRRGLFAPSFQILEATLFLGSLVFMIPFTIQIRSGEYALEYGILRTAITAIFLVSSILVHATSTYASIQMTTIRAVSSITNSVEEAAKLLILVAFAYSVLICRSQFGSLFEAFGIRFCHHSDQLKRQRCKIVLWTLIPFLCCLVIGNLTAWGENASSEGLAEIYDSYSKIGISKLLFQTRIGSNKIFQNVVTVIHLFLDTFAHCILMYTEMLLWAASLSIYWIEKKKRAFCTQEEIEFDLLEGTSIFRDLHEVVNRRLSRPLGPLLAASCISLVTFTVSGLTIICFDEWSWLVAIIMVIKAGHVLVAAEATANDENLLHQILTKRICPIPPIRANDSDETSNSAVVNSRLTFQGQLQEFKDAAREPLALKALDFANMNYALFGWVLVSAIGYFLVVAEWLKSEDAEGLNNQNCGGMR